MRRFVIFAGVCCLLIAVAIGLVTWDWPLTSRQDPETEDAYVEGDYRPLSARVSGYVRTLPIDDYQPVKAGQVIATLDDRDYRAQEAQIAAELAVAEANLQALVDRIRIARLQVDEARQGVTAAQAELLRNQEESQRQHVLLPTAVGLLRNVQQADAATRSQAATLQRAAATVDVRTQQVAVMEAEQASTEAAIRGQRASLLLAQINVGWTVVRAPFDGILGSRRVRVGQLVQPGGEIVSLTPLASVWVSANFAENQITHLAPGQPARVRADTWPTIEIPGWVDHIAPATGAQFAMLPADNVTGNYTKVVQRVEVKIRLDATHNPLYGQLRPGMSTLARVITTRRQPEVRELR